MECVKTEDTFIKSISALSKVEFEHRCRRLHNVLDENDLSSTTGGNHKGTDPIPLVITAEEWKTLEAGVAQRARLFNALANDIYGEQRLWKNGKLPAALLFANPDFLQVVWNVHPVGGIFVNLTSTDVARLKDGSFVAISDHLQVPEGLGRALENRIGVSRAFPELFRSMQTERLAGFFKKLMDGLDAMHKNTGGDGETSKVVLLASSPDNPRRAEDAVIARYLGIPLVENDDLAIRNMQVYMKTLMGLKKIGTIFRRVEDGMCDPLELRIDSGEGAVGLISSVRAGNVAIANFLGTGVLETPVFKMFLPEICSELLGEELLLRDAETLWLGNAADAERVLAEPEKWIFKKAFHDEGNFKEAEPKAYATMTTTAQLALLQAIENAPEQWVAEKNMEVSTIYAYRGEFSPAVSLMRFFAVNTTNGTSVMPGGLGIFKFAESNATSAASVSGAPTCATVTSAAGISMACAVGEELGEKDIWVLSENPVANFSLLAPASQAITPSRAGGDLPCGRELVPTGASIIVIEHDGTYCKRYRGEALGRILDGHAGTAVDTEGGTYRRNAVQARARSRKRTPLLCLAQGQQKRDAMRADRYSRAWHAIARPHFGGFMALPERIWHCRSAGGHRCGSAVTLSKRGIIGQRCGGRACSRLHDARPRMALFGTRS